ncbi:TPA: hypothetical protein M4161_004480 [Klebsiella pneumoniae]|nr:hypothetical protein [Klebsiella pneumoniae]
MAFLTITDVVSHEHSDFSRRVINVPLQQDVSPGDCIDSTGALVSSSSTNAFVMLEYAKASSTAVPLLVHGTQLYLKRFALKCDDVEKAIQLITQDPAVRLTGEVSQIPTT